MASGSSTKKPPELRDICGTTAGWNQHQVNGEDKDEKCLKAKAEYQQDWRLRTGRTKFKMVPLQQEES
jgi:hypothetical protein